MRTVVILYALEKQRYEDIAQITGVSVGTVKSRLNRARQKLAAILANQREQNEKSSVLPSERRTGKRTANPILMKTKSSGNACRP